MKQIILYSPSIILPIIFNVILYFIFGNFIDPEVYGQYNFYVTTINFSYILIGGMFINSLLRLQNEYKLTGELSNFISTIFTSILLISPFFFILEYVFLNSIILSLSLVAYIFSNFFSTFYRNENKVLIYSFIKVFPLFASLIILILLIFLLKSNVASLLMSNYGPILVVVLIFIWSFKKKSLLYLKYDYKIFKSIVKYGTPLIIVNVLNLVISSSDIVIIKLLMTPLELGYYSFTYKIAELAMITLASFLILTFYPSLIKIYNSKGDKIAQEALSKYFFFQLVISFPILLVMVIFSQDVLQIFFENYSESHLLLSLNLIGTFFFSLTYYTNKPYEISKKMANLIKTVCIVALTNIILNFAFIPRFGSAGASISTISSYLLYIYLSHKRAPVRLKIKLEFSKIIYLIISTLILFSFLYIFFELSFNNLISFIGTSISFLMIYFFLVYLYIKRHK